MVSRKYNRKKRKISRRIPRNRKKPVSLKRNKRGGAIQGLSNNYTYGFEDGNHKFYIQKQTREKLLKEPSGADITDIGTDDNLTNKTDFTFVENTKDTNGKKVTQYLGSGNFGNVVLVKMTQSGASAPTPVAVKQINLKIDLDQNKKAAKDLLEEYKIHYKLQSNPRFNHVTKLFGVIDPDKVGIKVVMENCPGVGLDKYFLSPDTIDGKQNKNKAVLDQIYKYIQQVAEALQFISNTDLGNKIVHRDISLKNILLCEKNPTNYVAKLSDFGLARQVSLERGDAKFYFKQNLSERVMLPMSLYSPDALNELKFGFENDVWSFGLLMYGLLFLNKKNGREQVGKATKYSNEEWYMKTHINREFNKEEKKELFGIGFIGKYLRPKEVLNKLNVRNPKSKLDPENLEDLKANHFYQTIIKGCFYEPQDNGVGSNDVSRSSELKQRFNMKTIVEKINEFITNYVDGEVNADKLIILYTSQGYTNKDKEDFEKLFPTESNYLNVLFYGCRCSEEDDDYVTVRSTTPQSETYFDVSENPQDNSGYLNVAPTPIPEDETSDKDYLDVSDPNGNN